MSESTGSSRHRISSGGPFEVAAGYSRAIVVGDSCWVAGTTDAGPGGISQHPGDVAEQARAALAIIEAALVEGGFTLADVVRTRMFITDAADAEAVGRSHAAVFGEVRPAATMVVVAGLLDPRWKIEIEIEAIVG